MWRTLRTNIVKTLSLRTVARQATASHRPGMHLVFDFDGTITERDTIGELARSAISWQQRRNGNGKLEAAWQDAVRAYADEHREFVSTYAPREHERTSVEDEAAYLAGMKASEERSLDRVGQTSIFEGMSADDFFQLGVEAVREGRVRLRTGFGEVLGLAARKGWRADVVSVNWSRDFIRGVLHPHAVGVTANEIDARGHIQAPRLDVAEALPGLLGRITTSADKLRAVRCLTRERSEDVFYFGDSPTDLECLLYGRGVAIAAEEESSLCQVLRRITGARVPSVAERSCRKSNSVGWARDFQEVLDSDVLNLEELGS